MDAVAMVDDGDDEVEVVEDAEQLWELEAIIGQRVLHGATSGAGCSTDAMEMDDRSVTPTDGPVGAKRAPPAAVAGAPAKKLALKAQETPEAPMTLAGMHATLRWMNPELSRGQ